MKLSKEQREALKRARAMRGRDQIWRCIRILQEFTISDLTAVTTSAEGSCRNFLGFLWKNRILAQMYHAKHEHAYFILSDPGPETPRFSRDGIILPPTKSEKMWRVIRGSKVFDRNDIVTLAEVSLDYAERYLKTLKQVGILMKVSRGCRGVLGKYALTPGYTTGPMPPAIKRANGTVYDPNTGETYSKERRADAVIL